jgi:hypothetical protein
MAEDFAEPVRQSYLMWLVAALGWRYMLLLPLAGLVSFGLTLFVVLRGKGAAQVGALLFIVPLPILVGIMGVVDGMIASYQVIAMSDTIPKPSQIALGQSMALVSALVGLMLAVPSYLLALGGITAHALLRNPPNGKGPP